MPTFIESKVVWHNQEYCWAPVANNIFSGRLNDEQLDEFLRPTESHRETAVKTGVHRIIRPASKLMTDDAGQGQYYREWHLYPDDKEWVELRVYTDTETLPESYAISPEALKDMLPWL